MGCSARIRSRPPKLVAATLCCAVGAVAAIAQGPGRVREELETDRDSFTFAPSTNGRGTAILETSCSFIDNRVGPKVETSEQGAWLPRSAAIIQGYTPVSGP